MRIASRLTRSLEATAFVWGYAALDSKALGPRPTRRPPIGAESDQTTKALIAVPFESHF